MDTENLIDELGIVKGRVKDMIEEIRDREKELSLCQRKLDEWREYKEYLEAKLSWCRLEQ